MTFAIIGIVLLSLVSGVVGGVLVKEADTTVTGGFPQTASTDGNKLASSEEKNLSELIDSVSPSVVSIITSVKNGDVLGNSVTSQAAGTGMIISKNGYIMTNKHVIDGATSAAVVLSNGRTYKNVPIVGSDPLNDIAFLKIPNATNLKPVTLGDSKTVRVGQSVIAIGNALGQYQNTVTSGIISGLGRPVEASAEDGTGVENLSDLLQTDAAINSGNSGGPLLNTSGQVIGMNTAMAQGAQSIGFAIPIGAAKGMIAHLVRSGEISRAYLGIKYVSITPEIKAHYDLSANQGDYVVADSGSAIQKGGPADKAGLKAKDIITKINGQTVGGGSSTSTLIGEFQPGDRVMLTVLRAGKTLELHVKLGTYRIS